MKEFNLLKEPWVAVMTNDKGRVEEVSLIELFSNAHEYKCLAGETPAQDFAVLRFLLAVLHTVFSRFDKEGNPYEGIELDERFQQTNQMHSDYEDDYRATAFERWEDLWKMPRFPKIINQYLEKNSDRFNLYDEKYPFYQISKTEMNSLFDEPAESTKGRIYFKYINRLLSESENKTELFAPASEAFKDELSEAALTRWLIAFQGYTGTSDKRKFPGMVGSASKGWLLGLGGIYLSGKTLKETLLLNMIMSGEMDSQRQKPIWEKSFAEKINDLTTGRIPDNLADLYTNWSRFLLIDSDENRGQFLRAVQLPGIDPQEFFLEPMTIWYYPESGDNKNHYIPKTHDLNSAFWRSFGLLDKNSMIFSKSKKTVRPPGILDWHSDLIKEKYLSEDLVTLRAVGLSYNRDASTMPNDEIYDELNIHNEVLADIVASGWVARISETVEITKMVIDRVLRNFANEIEMIRNVSEGGLPDRVCQDAYFAVDMPFREWLAAIKPEDNKDEKIIEWKDILKKIIFEQADKLLENATNRDFLGKKISEKGKSEEIYNIMHAYNKFKNWLLSPKVLGK